MRSLFWFRLSLAFFRETIPFDSGFEVDDDDDDDDDEDDDDISFDVQPPKVLVSPALSFSPPHGGLRRTGIAWKWLFTNRPCCLFAIERERERERVYV